MKETVDNNENINVATNGASLFYKLWVGKSCNSKYELNEKNEIVGYSEGSEEVEYRLLFEKGEIELIDTKFQIKEDKGFSSIDWQPHSFIVQNSFGEFFLLSTKYPDNYIKKFEFDIQSKPDSIVKVKINDITNFLTEEQLGIVNQKVEEVKPVVELKKEVVKEIKTEEIKQEVIQPVQEVKKQSFVVSNKVRKQLPLLVIEQLTKMDNTQQLLFEQEFKKKSKKLEIAYLCLFLLGCHYIYFKKNSTQFVFWITGGGFGFWALYDLLRMSKLVKEYNEDIAIDVITTVKVLS